MIEDKSFNAFLKAKLEEDVVVPAIVSRHGNGLESSAILGCDGVASRVRLRPYLLAASLAIICGVFSWQFVASNNASSERDTLHAIALLDDSECIASADTFADKLLAWQDAPFGEIEN